MNYVIDFIKKPKEVIAKKIIIIQFWITLTFVPNLKNIGFSSRPDNHHLWIRWYRKEARPNKMLKIRFSFSIELRFYLFKINKPVSSSM